MFVLIFVYLSIAFRVCFINQVSNYRLSTASANEDIGGKHASERLLYRQKTSRSFFSLRLPIYCLQDLLNQKDYYRLSTVSANKDIDEEHASEQFSYRQKTSRSFLSLRLPVYCLQDLLNQIDNYRLSSASANREIEKNTHLNGISTDRKLALLFSLFVCCLLSTRSPKSNR